MERFWWVSSNAVCLFTVDFGLILLHEEMKSWVHSLPYETRGITHNRNFNGIQRINVLKSGKFSRLIYVRWTRKTSLTRLADYLNGIKWKRKSWSDTKYKKDSWNTIQNLTATWCYGIHEIWPNAMKTTYSNLYLMEIRTKR